MKIVENYSEKSFAVIGEDCKDNAQILKEFGGKFNPALKCGKGWIFSNKMLKSVREIIENPNKAKNEVRQKTIEEKFFDYMNNRWTEFESVINSNFGQIWDVIDENNESVVGRLIGCGCAISYLKIDGRKHRIIDVYGKIRRIRYDSRWLDKIMAKYGESKCKRFELFAHFHQDYEVGKKYNQVVMDFMKDVCGFDVSGIQQVTVLD